MTKGKKALKAKVPSRRLLSSLAVYVGAAWGVLEAGQFFVSYFGWSPAVLRALVLGVICGLPATLVVAWHHGAPGKQRVTRREVLLLSLIASVWFGLFLGGGGTVVSTAPTSGATLNSKRVAVLYFQNLSSDASLNWLAAGCTDALISRLSVLKGIEVMSRSRVAPYRGARPADPSIIAADLGCGSIIIGSYQIAGKALRLSCQVLRAPEGVTLHAMTLDGKLSDVFSLQDELAAKLASLLLVRSITAKQAENRLQTTIPAYRAYCLALEAIDEHRFDRAATHLQEAIEGGMVYAPSLDELLAVIHQTVSIDAEGGRVFETLERATNPQQRERSVTYLQGTFEVLGARSATGTPLRTEHLSRDEAGNNRYAIHLDSPQSADETLLYWWRGRNVRKLLYFGNAWYFHSPKWLAYLGPERRLTRTLALPPGAEPLYVWPPPTRIFFRDGRCRMAWARRLGADVELEISLFYTADKAMLERASRAQSFSPDLLYTPEYSSTEGAIIQENSTKKGPLDVGDVIWAVDGRETSSLAQVSSAISALPSSAPVELSILRHGERRKITLASNALDIRCGDAPYLPVGAEAYPGIVVTRALMELARGRPQSAVDSLLRLLAGSMSLRSRGAALALLAKCQLALGNDEEAKAYVSKAIAHMEKVELTLLEPIPAECYRCATSILKERLRKDPQDFMAAYGLARALLERGANRDADRAIRRALALEPSAVWNLLLAARCALGLGDLRRATSLGFASVGVPSYEGRAILADYCRRNGHHDAALTIMLAFLDEYQKCVSRVLSDALVDCAEHDDIEGARRLMIASRQDWSGAINDIAYDLLKKKQMGPALLMARFNGQRNPEIAYIQDSLGEILYENGRYEEARAVFAGVLKLDPKQLRSHLFLGRILVKEGNADEARGHLVKASVSTNEETARVARQELSKL